MLSEYLTQTAMHTPARRNADGSAKMDSRGQIQYEGARIINCRRQPQTKEIVTPDRQTIQITDTYYTITPVQIDDLINGRRAQYREDWFGLDGDIVGYKVMV